MKSNGIVVSGFLRQGDKFLVGMRPEGKPCPNVVEFIGGKRDPEDKSSEDALLREYKEESGVKVKIIGPMVFEKNIQFSDNLWTVQMFEVEIVEGEPECRVHQWLKWLTWDELQDLPLSPSLIEVMKIYKHLGSYEPGNPLNVYLNSFGNPPLYSGGHLPLPQEFDIEQKWVKRKVAQKQHTARQRKAKGFIKTNG